MLTEWQIFVQGALVLALMSLAFPASAQEVPGRVAVSSVGQAGQQQGYVQETSGIEPMARLDSRIQNRVPSRLRNRIDRYYDPQANRASPVEIAVDQARVAGQRRRR